MNFKTNLLSAAIAASLLTACGGSSNSGSGSADQAPYTSTSAEQLTVGKAFVASLDAQAEQLSTGLGKFGAPVVSAIFDLDEEENGEVEVDGIKQGLWASLQGLIALQEFGSLLREVGEVGLEAYNERMANDSRDRRSGPDSAGFALGTIYEGYGPDGQAKFQFLEDEAGNLQLNTQSSFEYNQGEIAVANYTFTYTKTSVTEAQLLVSGTIVDSETGLDATITNAAFTGTSIITGSTVNFAVENITVLLGDLTLNASASADLVVGGPGADSGTLDAIPYGDYISSAAAMLSGIDVDNDDYSGEMLNLLNFEISGLRIEAAAGEYLTAESILFEDADAADYLGSDGYGSVASFEYSEDKNTLTLSNNLGSTVYTYTPAVVPAQPQPPAPSEPRLLAVSEEPSDSAPAKISCVTESNTVVADAPTFTRISCDEEAEETGYGSLFDLINNNGYRVSTGQGSDYYIHNRDFSEMNGELKADVNNSIDAIDEPVTFSVSANGELGLSGGLTVPYQLSLNHPGAYNYQAEAVIGLAPSTLTANFSTLEKDIVVSTKVPFVPADTDFSSADAEVKLSYTWTEAEEDEEAGIVTIGTITVDDVVVGSFTQLENVNGDVLTGALEEANDNHQPLFALTFTDGTYPTAGVLFSTVEDMIEVDCAEGSVETECFADQAGVVDLTTVTNLFFEGMPLTGPLFEPVEEGKEE